MELLTMALVLLLAGAALASIKGPSAQPRPDAPPPDDAADPGTLGQ
jgi:hypothetical protein